MIRYYKFDEESKYKSMLNRSYRNELLSFLDKSKWRQVKGDEYLLYAFCLYKAVANSGILNKYVYNDEEIKDGLLFK